MLTHHTHYKVTLAFGEAGLPLIMETFLPGGPDVDAAAADALATFYIVVEPRDRWADVANVEVVG